MKNILSSPFLKEFVRTASNMYRLGYDERNGGNISMLLEYDEYKDFVPEKPVRTLPLFFDAKELAGKAFLVTGTGKYFKNIELNPEINLGLIRISEDGLNAELLWGLIDGSRPTSELPSHLMSHIARLKVNPNNKIVMHCHPGNLISMTLVEDLDEKSFTKLIWKANTECIVVFPEGIAVLPWILCGTNEIGEVTAEKMKDFRVVVWANHGIFAVGDNLDEAFGLVETIEKTAQIYLTAKPFGIKNTISDCQLKQLVKFFKLEKSVKEGWLE